MKSAKSLWVILDKDGNFCAFGSKVAWISSSAAKNAFSCHTFQYIGSGYGINVKLDDSPEYRLVEINSKGVICKNN